MYKISKNFTFVPLKFGDSVESLKLCDAKIEEPKLFFNQSDTVIF